MVLVHGAWHGASCWDGVVVELGRRGVTVTAAELPFGGLAADVAVARAAIEAAGSGSVVVGHSYGGAVITQAAAGLPVARLVYLAAFLTEPGEDIVGLMAGSRLLESLIIDESGIRVDPDAAAAVFYGDADAETAATMIGRLRPMVLEGVGTAGCEAAWRSIPTTYVVCTNDQALPVGSQRTMAARAVEVVDWPTDHSPFLTRPGAIADLVTAYLV